jgi:hypothetical protein
MRHTSTVHLISRRNRAGSTLQARATSEGRPRALEIAAEMARLNEHGQPWAAGVSLPIYERDRADTGALLAFEERAQVIIVESLLTEQSAPVRAVIDLELNAEQMQSLVDSGEIEEATSDELEQWVWNWIENALEIAQGDAEEQQERSARTGPKLTLELLALAYMTFLFQYDREPDPSDVRALASEFANDEYESEYEIDSLTAEVSAHLLTMARSFIRRTPGYRELIDSAPALKPEP